MTTNTVSQNIQEVISSSDKTEEEMSQFWRPPVQQQQKFFTQYAMSEIKRLGLVP
jgi:hypothetical protein